MIIKAKPEDFIVEEVQELNFLDQGRYACFKLKKKNWTTYEAINLIASKLRIPSKLIGFAGNKDKRAITTQYITIKSSLAEKLEKLKLKDITLEFVGYLKRPITLGMLKGNGFKIKIRNYNKLRRVDFFVNYFGEQRFEGQTHKIGKFILKRNFKEACELINKRVIKQYLSKYPNDYVGALQQLDKRELRFYISAYQSYLWNKYAKLLVEKECCQKFYANDYVFCLEKISNRKIPFITFDLELKEFPAYQKILKEEKVTQEEFVIKAIPDITPLGDKRDFIVEVKDFKANASGKNVILQFELPKGSYATVLIKKYINLP